MSENKHHITPLKTYLIVFFSLLFLTAITVYSAQYDFGSFNIVLALIIASFKSSLVLLFFMHLYYDNKINLIFILGSVLFLAIFIGITMIDTNQRTTLYDIRGKLVNEQTPIENFKKTNIDHNSDHNSDH
tara:strand:- start:664 stop:1053 length:390 start_codon:yes stop_codon:yes gene_type:complete